MVAILAQVLKPPLAGKCRCGSSITRGCSSLTMYSGMERAETTNQCGDDADYGGSVLPYHAGQVQMHTGTDPNRHIKTGTGSSRQPEFCKFFRQGLCSRGKTCSFAHYPGQLRPRSNLLRTGLCHIFMETGICKIRSSCKFAHGVQELRLPVLEKTQQATESELWKRPSSPSEAEKMPADALRDCKFAHSILATALGTEDQALDSESASTISSDPPQGQDRTVNHLKAQTQSGRPIRAHLKTRYCKFFREGRCMRADLCMFAHATQDIRAEPNLFKTSPCFDFLRTGLCRVGESCKFAHTAQELREPEPVQLQAQLRDAGLLGTLASTDLLGHLPQASFLSEMRGEATGPVCTDLPSADPGHNGSSPSILRSGHAADKVASRRSSDDAQGGRTTQQLLVEAEPSRVQANFGYGTCVSHTEIFSV
ncbi:unnamed protein product [Polarella glacialis]|uniref:C3H1-type domain-containing protein n=1 Tax=Polarella glacialis TaxID=89957 RepID=A0A813GN34_POLGL|nr:unnamed protein product [Polarella glacialis]